MHAMYKSLILCFDNPIRTLLLENNIILCCVFLPAEHLIHVFNSYFVLFQVSVI